MVLYGIRVRSHLLLISAAALFALGTKGEGEELSPISADQVPGAVRGTATPAQVVAALTPVAQLGSTALRANDEVSRGSAASVYAKAAPSVVLIQAGNSSGSGFVIQSNGWIITNNHVVAQSPIHMKSGARLVKVYLGHLDQQAMVLDQPSVPAFVYKTDEAKDLALLELVSLPKGVKSLPVVQIAKSVSSPGSECVVIGNPSAGLLWTVRQGGVASVGYYPQDLMPFMLARLNSTGKDAEVLGKALAESPPRKVLISTCLINPGDSGSPLLNSDGEVIGVSFAAPLVDVAQRKNLDSFTYHIHLDELKAFLKEAPPAEPPPFIPDPWPPSLLCKLADMDKDKIPETLGFVMKPDGPLIGYLCDLKQDSSADFDPAKLADPAMRKLWHFQFAAQMTPVHRTFYDTANSGQIDLILTDFNNDNIADLVLKRQNGVWKVVPANGQKMMDPSLFSDKEQAARFIRIHGLNVKSPPAVKETPKAKA